MLLILSACLFEAACSPKQLNAQAEAQPDPEKVLQAAREYGKGRVPVASGVNQTAVAKGGGFSEATEEQYTSEVTGALVRKEFDRLEQEARLLRTGIRIPGGTWRLLIFYEALGDLQGEGADQDANWAARIALLKEWSAAKKDLATPRLAIAETFFNWGAHARGSGYARTVSDDAWALERERSALAAGALLEAARVSEKCVFWYEVAEHLALSQGWNKTQARELFEVSIAFEPTYYHFYREYANYLLPKWYGEEGEAEAFAEEASKRAGGQQGQYLYFEIASQLVCQCISERPPMPNVSWPRVKEGYAVLSKLYGHANRKDNRMAFMAYVADDRPAAQEAFARIGFNADKQVWHGYDSFLKVKEWASNQQAKSEE